MNIQYGISTRVTLVVQSVTRLHTKNLSDESLLPLAAVSVQASYGFSHVKKSLDVMGFHFKRRHPHGITFFLFCFCTVSYVSSI